MSAPLPPAPSPEPHAGEGGGLTLSDFDFALPDELIAQVPLPERAASRLLHVGAGAPVDRMFRDLPSLLAPGDLLVLNDTRVIKARLRGHRETGGRVELLVERIVDERTVVTMLRSSKTPAPGSRILIDATTDAGSAPAGEAKVLGREGEFFVLRFDRDVAPLLEAAGELPLPPYIARTPCAADGERYQTVYAAHPGAVAAPTAGLHFDAALFDAIAARGVRTAPVTLHVGAGTFQPVRVERIDEHRMHAERYEIPQSTVDLIAATRAAGGRIVAVGTTSLRALESAAATDGILRAGSAETRLFVKPGDPIRVVDRLVTNFHLPKSTLLMLVSAFGGLDRIRAAYAHAIRERYRFFSYGDAMLLEKAPA